MQLKHAEVQSQCKEHKDRLQRLQNTYYLLKTACDKRMSDLHRIDQALEESVNTRCALHLQGDICQVHHRLQSCLVTNIMYLCLSIAQQIRDS